MRALRDFPEDILDAAKFSCLLPADFTHYEAQVRVIARGLLAERVRCAQAVPFPPIELPDGMSGVAEIEAFWRGVEMTRHAVSRAILKASPDVQASMPTILPNDRLFHSIMGLKTEHGDSLNVTDATEFYEALLLALSSLKAST